MTKLRLGKKVSVAVAASVALGAVLLFACEDEPNLRTDPSLANGGGGECSVAPGLVPPAKCDDSKNTKCRATPECAINEAKCGSAATCLPTADNAGKNVFDLRLRRLNIAAPAVLAEETIQQVVVTSNLDLNAKECGEGGKAFFNWLIRVDRDKNEIFTGGAPPTTDAFGKGFCFANFKSPDGIQVSPVTFPIEFQGNTFKTTTKNKLAVPIFISADPSSVVVLPLTDVSIENVEISENNNCIGSFVQGALDKGCKEDPVGCSKWHTAGALGGYITIEESDAVFVKDLNQSLCVLLTSTQKGPDGKCVREGGKLPAVGDYCSTDKQAGSCKDSFWLAATFAAAAVKVNDGAGIEGCGLAVQAKPDAGADAGGAGDAGTADGGDAGDGG